MNKMWSREGLGRHMAGQGQQWHVGDTSFLSLRSLVLSQAYRNIFILILYVIYFLKTIVFVCVCVVCCLYVSVGVYMPECECRG